MEAELPVEDDFECWLGSPKILVENLKILLTIPNKSMAPHMRQINMPGITATVKEMLEALEAVGGKEATNLVKRKPMAPEVRAVLDSWAFRVNVSKALSLGLIPDQPFIGAVEDFARALKAEGKKVEGRIPRKLKKGILRKAAKRDPKPKTDGKATAAKAKASKKGKTFKA